MLIVSYPVPLVCHRLIRRMLLVRCSALAGEGVVVEAVPGVASPEVVRLVVVMAVAVFEN